MKQIIDETGKSITGLFRDDNGAIIVNKPSAYMQAQIQSDNFALLNNEVNILKEQMRQIMGKLNG